MQFVTAAEEFRVTEAPFAVPLRLNHEGLSGVICHLLELEPAVPFDFFVEGELLRSSLRKHMRTHGVSHVSGLRGGLPALLGTGCSAMCAARVCPVWSHGHGHGHGHRHGLGVRAGCGGGGWGCGCGESPPYCCEWVCFYGSCLRSFSVSQEVVVKVVYQPAMGQPKETAGIPTPDWIGAAAGVEAHYLTGGYDGYVRL